MDWQLFVLKTSGWICFGYVLFCERLMVSCYDREIRYCSFSASNAQQLQFDFLASPFLSTVRFQDRGGTVWCAVSDLGPSQLAEVSTATIVLNLKSGIFPDKDQRSGSPSGKRKSAAERRPICDSRASKSKTLA